MAAKKVKLINANFRSWSSKFAGEAVTTVQISAPFEQLVAEQLGVKSRIYTRKPDEDDPDFDGFSLGIDWYGAGLTFMPVQGTLDGKAKTDGSVFIRCLRLHDVTIKRHKDDEQMLVSFSVVTLDGDAALHQLLHAVKKSPINIDIQPPSKAAAKEASDQMRLISQEQADDTAEGADA